MNEKKGMKNMKKVTNTIKENTNEKHGKKN